LLKIPVVSAKHSLSVVQVIELLQTGGSVLSKVLTHLVIFLAVAVPTMFLKQEFTSSRPLQEFVVIA
jgi:hypothetical protein